jgi:hypothetical protein
MQNKAKLGKDGKPGENITKAASPCGNERDDRETRPNCRLVGRDPGPIVQNKANYG